MLILAVTLQITAANSSIDQKLRYETVRLLALARGKKIVKRVDLLSGVGAGMIWS